MRKKKKKKKKKEDHECSVVMNAAQYFLLAGKPVRNVNYQMLLTK